VRIPPGLDWWRTYPGGAAWLERLPRLAAECAERWALRLSEPFAGSHVSLVVPAGLPDGTRAVLKINFPDPESEREADALDHWRGEGAVRLLAHDPERRALLVERCEPGTPLWELDDEVAMPVALRVLERIWKPPPAEHAFRPLAAEARRWAVDLRSAWEELGRPFETELLEEAVAACLELGPDQGAPVVLHQDFHGGNVLRAEREPWLAIDPKPLVGEREFDAASLLRDRRDLLVLPGAARIVRRRLDLLVAELGLERERMRRWGIAHALAWGVSGTAQKVEEDMVACARVLRQCVPKRPSRKDRPPDRSVQTDARAKPARPDCRRRKRPPYDGRMSWDQWVRGVEIEPSLYAADFSRLGQQIDAVMDAGAKIFQFDVGDGHFIEPITIGPIVLQSISELVHGRGGVLDVHLMIEFPQRHFRAVAEAGGDSVTFHLEAVDDATRAAAAARELGLAAGLAFNPETEPEDAAAAAADVDLVLCMSIHPGYSGQEFMPEALGRIRRLRDLLPGSKPIQVDGGVGPENVGALVEAGATLLVAGSSVYGGDDPAAAYRRLVDALP
jgi:streptomycin 6-kinase